ncbi:MAG: ABC transporter ATP-binding protein [Clostridia bacterium]|nr:ABC transporter ATP-binding protein [Clostridia bacterium]
MSLIECKNLSVAYEGRIVVKNLSFSINSGDAVCIVGENGSGKSTLMKSMLGLMKTAGGSIKFGDGLKQSEIGYLPQQTDVQRDFPASVGEIVLSGCLNKMGIFPFFNKKIKLRANENMEKLGILDLKDRCYHELSGGQQQRVLLARALCATDKLLLLDEPVAGLDPIVTGELYELIKKLHEEGITVVMVSHDIEASLGFADHILHLNHDNSFFGTTEEYKRSPFGKRFMGGVQSE